MSGSSAKGRLRSWGSFLLSFALTLGISGMILEDAIYLPLKREVRALKRQISFSTDRAQMAQAAIKRIDQFREGTVQLRDELEVLYRILPSEIDISAEARQVEDVAEELGPELSVLELLAPETHELYNARAIRFIVDAQTLEQLGNLIERIQNAPSEQVLGTPIRKVRKLTIELRNMRAEGELTIYGRLDATSPETGG